ncbi:hypothetical protein AB1Y20_000520 [Prymnesium parvum]|uniref:tRNA-dihydrouridine(16/17) synthase [NAD(P)(+)] n=1 Tax=Prymnesium parvum TaxID=97485 RepID=A0AB34K9R2_PRYPA
MAEARPHGQPALLEAKARREEARQQLERLAEAASHGEELSKSARKRLLKLRQLEELRPQRKEVKKQRKQSRRASSHALPPAPPEDDAREPHAPPSLEQHVAAAWARWAEIGAPRLVLAPMVNQSERAFRLLARRYGAQLCYTPMLHSTLFSTEEYYRLDNFDPLPEEGALVVQFCGDDPATVLAAARMVETQCVAVDLNCGCPQAIAKRGHYGAFLLDEPELICSIVETLARRLRCLSWVKMRVLPSSSGEVDIDATVALALRLQSAGCSVLALHGRTREQKCACECDWHAIGKVKAALSIPVIANGGIETPEDIDRCLQATGCDAVMISEAALENPAIFSGTPTSRASQIKLTREYIELSREHPPRSVQVVKAHLFKFLFMALEVHRDLREQLGSAMDVEKCYTISELVCQKEEKLLAERPDEMWARCDSSAATFTTWYRRHRGSNHPSASQQPCATPV